jgi:hypothetical protein
MLQSAFQYAVVERMCARCTIKGRKKQNGQRRRRGESVVVVQKVKTGKMASRGNTFCYRSALPPVLIFLGRG